jgi:hypothetical protein
MNAPNSPAAVDATQALYNWLALLVLLALGIVR